MLRDMSLGASSPTVTKVSPRSVARTERAGSIRRQFSLLLLLFCATLVAQCQTLDVNLTVTQADGRPVMRLTNSRDMPIDAFLITIDLFGPQQPLHHEPHDVHVDYGRDQPIPAFGTRDLFLPHLIGGTLPEPSLRAVIFSATTTT